MKIRYKSLISVLVAILMMSCSSMRLEDFFSSYTQQMKPSLAAQLRGDYLSASSLIPQHQPGHNSYALSYLEKGRLNFLAGRWQQSELDFSVVYQDSEYERNRAKVQLGKGLQNIGSLVSNDSAIKYQVPAYEQSMMHSYQALNYLYLGQLESALVEIRRANLVQAHELANNKSTVYNAQQSMFESGIDDQAFNKIYPSMDKSIGKVKNSFQNAYTFYISGLLYESVGQDNDAYIDYKKALEIYPDNQYLQLDILRLANKLNMEDDLELFSEKFKDVTLNEAAIESAKSGEKSGYLVVFYEENLVNQKQMLSLNLPINTHDDELRFYSFSLPIYADEQYNSHPLHLNVDDTSYQSEEIVRLQSMATKHLKDQMPAIVARQALRIISKEKLRKKMNKEGGEFGNVIAAIYNVASEKADTRSWLSLPGSVQVMKLPLDEGAHNITLDHVNGSADINIEIKANRTTMIYATTVGEHFDYQSTYL